MPRARNLVPSYPPFDTAKTRARAVWRNAAGRRQYRVLPGPFNSPESLPAFARLQAELAVSSSSVPSPAASGRTIAEVLLAFLKHAEVHYRGAEDGKPTSEYREYKGIVRTLRGLYGSTPADDFGPLALKAVRQTWLTAGFARSEINRRVNMVRRLFKWAAGEELIKCETYHRLTGVTGLQKERTPTRETEPIGPVVDATVDATLPHLNRHVRGIVTLLRLSTALPQCSERPSPAYLQLRRRNANSRNSENARGSSSTPRFSALTPTRRHF